MYDVYIMPSALEDYNFLVEVYCNDKLLIAENSNKSATAIHRFFTAHYGKALKSIQTRRRIEEDNKMEDK